MPEWAELWIKSGQRCLLITSYKRLKKKTHRAMTPAMEAVCIPKHLAPPGSLKAKQLPHLHTQFSLGQTATGQKKKKTQVLCLCAGSLQSCPTLCDPVDCGLPGFSGREGVPRQEHWSVLANAGCHTLLEQYISCCPSRQPP